MNIKQFLSTNAILISLITVSLVTFDYRLAYFIKMHLSFLRDFFYETTLLVDKVFDNIQAWYFLALFFAPVLILFSQTRKIAFVVITCIITTGSGVMITNILKSEVKRPRPDVYLATSDKAGTNQMLSKDYSFPSGHTSFYFGLCWPFWFISRRFFTCFSILPALVIIGRVVQNEHFLSDVLFSVTLTFNIATAVYCFFWFLEKKLKISVEQY